MVVIWWPFCFRNIDMCPTSSVTRQPQHRLVQHPTLWCTTTHYHMLNATEVEACLYTIMLVCICVCYPLPANLPTWPTVLTTSSFHIYFALSFRFLYPSISQWGEGEATTRRDQGYKHNKDITTGSRDSCPNMYVIVSEIHVHVVTDCYTCMVKLWARTKQFLLMVCYKAFDIHVLSVPY